MYQDKLCHDADGVLAVNRVKPHTGFTERVESGICKMLVIGMGKQAGASKIHHQALRLGMGRLVLEGDPHHRRIAPVPRLVGAIALVENAFKETAVVQERCRWGATTRSSRRRARLLERAYSLLPRLPFEELDGLIVDEIGKNVSGAGMDTNVIGKKDGHDQAADWRDLRAGAHRRDPRQCGRARQRRHHAALAAPDASTSTRRT